MTKKRNYSRNHGSNKNHRSSKSETVLPPRRNGANVHVVTCLCGMRQRLILSKFIVKRCVNRLEKCHHNFYLKDGEVCIGGLKKS